MAIERIVIVGGGLAGAKGAEALRDKGFKGEVTLVGEEPHLPYERPPLSKSYLLGETPFDEAIVHPADWYDANHVTLRLGVRAQAIDRARREVALSDGSVLGYDGLLLATGSSPRRPRLPGADAAGVHYLRTLEDADALRALFGDGRRLAIVGAGWIGLEVAAAARHYGTRVTVVEMADQPLAAVIGAHLGAFYADVHRDHGVDLRLGVGVAEIRVRDGKATGLTLTDGAMIDADAVVVGVGAAPNVALAESAGLTVDNGVLVDAALRTSDPAIFAVGDIANHLHPVLNTRVRVEHWANALNQPATAAAAMLGEDVHYDNLPYFYSDQYDVSMEYIGYGAAGDPVVRGDTAKREFVAFWLSPDSTLQAVMAVNVWDVIDAVKSLIMSGVRVDPTRLVDASVPITELAG
jgi:NADPH-dependent 2,4-dienoyl-CoA reductase/sulfur reductase-like enzyme